MKKIAIIGCGFSGTMTAVHLIKKSDQPVELILIDQARNFNKGIAYNPYSKNQLLNVVASRMSAFDDKPGHFVDWISGLSGYSEADRHLLANAYLPRYLYGQYLEGIWEEALLASAGKNIRITVKDAIVKEMVLTESTVMLKIDNGDIISADYCILASGNSLPGNPGIENTRFFNSRNYLRNPWDVNAVKSPDPNLPVFILGNGLTMADTVLGLVENGFRNKIFSISPHGFAILQHKHHGIGYSDISAELHEKQTLKEIVGMVRKHARIAKNLGFTAEPVIDALRPFSQQIWQNMDSYEKRMFMSRLRHLWEKARHRIPMHVHDKIRQLTLEGQLKQITGRLINVTETEAQVKVYYTDFQKNTREEILVSTLINCTGPATDLLKTDGGYLKNCLLNGLIIQDELKLGIAAHPTTFEVLNPSHEPMRNVLAIGSLLKGVLWETTAVKELRAQAESIAVQLTQKLRGQSGS